MDLSEQKKLKAGERRIQKLHNVELLLKNWYCVPWDRVVMECFYAEYRRFNSKGEFTDDGCYLELFSVNKGCGTHACLGGWASLMPEFRNHFKDVMQDQMMTQCAIVFGTKALFQPVGFSKYDKGMDRDLSDWQVAERRMLKHIAKEKKALGL
jgi:hypothetical protein